MCAKNRSRIREVGISIMSESGISRFFFMALRCGNHKGKVVGVQEFSSFVTALKGSLKEVTDRTTRTFSVVFWLYRVIKAFKLCFCSHKHVFHGDLPLPQDMIRGILEIIFSRG